MSTLSGSGQFNRSTESNAALIEACGRVFAASLQADGSGIYEEASREKRATSAVKAFLAALDA